jgi:hypothetical protein
VGALVVGTGYLYNPNGRKVLSYREVKQWRHGHAIVGPDEVFPKTYIRINGDMYYLDMNALTDSDFEEIPHLSRRVAVGVCECVIEGLRRERSRIRTGTSSTVSLTRYRSRRPNHRPISR